MEKNVCMLCYALLTLKYQTFRTMLDGIFIIILEETFLLNALL